MEKAVELDKKAAYYAGRAKAAKNNTAISSDDPDAIEKLKSKLATLEAEREKVKASNKEPKRTAQNRPRGIHSHILERTSSG